MVNRTLIRKCSCAHGRRNSAKSYRRKALGTGRIGNASLDSPRRTERHSLKESTKKMNVSSAPRTTESWYKRHPVRRDFSSTISNALLTHCSQCCEILIEAAYRRKDVLVCFLLLGPKLTWKGRGLLQLIVSRPWLRELRGGTQGTNLETGTEANTMENTAHWLVTHSLLSPFSNTTEHHPPGMSMPTGGWLFPCSVKKITYRLAYRPNQWRQFLKWCSFSPSDSNWHQRDQKSNQPATKCWFGSQFREI